ncbi:sugar 3,4-ketoisomerase [Vibrio antiquarius]|uniref:sugar 3,4-ketoisomerase n=1 Tax=Vibrio antiquarius (strain Ex25) TaxID=150340 RepID=UPI002659F72C|nr:FdtA/QdtA family cupin domain-containing protein [Vibrio antiquarius]MCR9581206.1 FdtA/QdtA family cupin domain-containing protein [Vibrio antiquarius]MCR9616338.1 FdtA/QdtA family cupin domain-containing protein [Vibrio antiquarius]
MSIIKLLKFMSFGDERGSLVSLEENNNIPFKIKRVYYIYNTESSASRGYHAHKNLEQVAVCLKGSCRFILDDGKEKEEIVLNDPSIGLYIDSMKWREMHDFSSDCVLIVLASNVYDENDYIRDYKEFLSQVEDES